MGRVASVYHTMSIHIMYVMYIMHEEWIGHAHTTAAVLALSTVLSSSLGAPLLGPLLVLAILRVTRQSSCYYGSSNARLQRHKGSNYEVQNWYEVVSIGVFDVQGLRNWKQIV
jgi:hypothetical protein